MNSIKIIVKIDNRLTKVRSRQAVKLPAVQPVVMATGHRPAFLGRKNEKNYFINDTNNILFNCSIWAKY